MILLSGLHISVATHLCCGEGNTFVKISVNGELASCGMEDADDSGSLPGTYFKVHCCDDELSVFHVDNNYASSSLEFKSFSPNVLQVFFIPESFTLNSLNIFNVNSSDVRPPGNVPLSEVSLPKICVFRI